jgi:DNA adenine methylase
MNSLVVIPTFSYTLICMLRTRWGSAVSQIQVDTVTRHRPFLKWPGGKFRLLSHILPHLPKKSCLVEPFVGAGSIFFNAQFSQCVLNDINPDLMNLYHYIQATGPACIEHLQSFFHPKSNSSRRYYQLRTQFNRTQDSHEKAALFLYLNRHGYNGLCRYNNKGGYNVPFGYYVRPYFPHKEILHFLHLSQHSKIHLKCTHFTDVIQQAPKGAVIYCDPPYVPLSKTANFTGYYHAFGLDEQRQLAESAHLACKRGCTVLISNHDVPFTRELYHTAKLVTFSAQRNISCNSKKRGRVGELLALYAP